MKTMDFSETIATSDLKVDRSRHLTEFMKVGEYTRSRNDLGHMKIKTCFSKKPLGQFKSNFVYKL